MSGSNIGALYRGGHIQVPDNTAPVTGTPAPTRNNRRPLETTSRNDSPLRNIDDIVAHQLQETTHRKQTRCQPMRLATGNAPTPLPAFNNQLQTAATANTAALNNNQLTTARFEQPGGLLAQSRAWRDHLLTLADCQYPTPTNETGIANLATQLNAVQNHLDALINQQHAQRTAWAGPPQIAHHVDFPEAKENILRAHALLDGVIAGIADNLNAQNPQHLKAFIKALALMPINQRAKEMTHRAMMLSDGTAVSLIEQSKQLRNYLQVRNEQSPSLRFSRRFRANQLAHATTANELSAKHRAWAAVHMPTFEKTNIALNKLQTEFNNTANPTSIADHVDKATAVSHLARNLAPRVGAFNATDQRNVWQKIQTEVAPLPPSTQGLLMLDLWKSRHSAPTLTLEIMNFVARHHQQIVDAIPHMDNAQQAIAFDILSRELNAPLISADAAQSAQENLMLVLWSMADALPNHQASLHALGTKYLPQFMAQLINGERLPQEQYFVLDLANQLLNDKTIPDDTKDQTIIQLFDAHANLDITIQPHAETILRHCMRPIVDHLSTTQFTLARQTTFLGALNASLTTKALTDDEAATLLEGRHHFDASLHTRVDNFAQPHLTILLAQAFDSRRQTEKDGIANAALRELTTPATTTAQQTRQTQLLLGLCEVKAQLSPTEQAQTLQAVGQHLDTLILNDFVTMNAAQRFTIIEALTEQLDDPTSTPQQNSNTLLAMLTQMQHLAANDQRDLDLLLRQQGPDTLIASLENKPLLQQHAFVEWARTQSELPLKWSCNLLEKRNDLDNSLQAGVDEIAENARTLLETHRGTRSPPKFWRNAVQHKDEEILQAILSLQPDVTKKLSRTPSAKDRLTSVLHTDMTTLSPKLIEQLSAIPHVPENFPKVVNTNCTEGFECSELSTIWATQRQALSTGTFDYSQLSDITTRTTKFNAEQIGELYFNLRKHSKEIHRIAPQNLGNLIAKQFELNNTPIWMMIETPVHTMSLELKTETREGKVYYVATCYDPNATNLETYVETPNLEALRKLGLPLLLPPNAPFSSYFTTQEKLCSVWKIPGDDDLQPSQTTAPATSWTSTLDENADYSPCDIYYMLTHGLHDSLKDLPNKISATTSADEIFKLFSFKGDKGTTGLFQTFQEGHEKNISTLSEIFSKLSHIPSADKIEGLLLSEDDERVPGPFMAFQKNQFGVLREMFKMLPNLGLSPDAIERLSTAKRQNGITGPHVAFSYNNSDVIRELMNFLPSSGLSTERIERIFTNKTTTGTPPLVTAFSYNASAAITTFLERLPACGLSSSQIKNILTAPNAKGIPPMHIALQKGHSDSIRALKNFLPQLGLELADMAVLLYAQKQDGTIGLFSALNSGHEDAITAFGELLQSSGLEEEDKLAILEQILAVENDDGSSMLESTLSVLAGQGKQNVIQALHDIVPNTSEFKPFIAGYLGS